MTRIYLVIDGQRHPIERERTRIGRSPDCDIQIDAESVSRHHCELVLTPAGLTVHDLKSRNGTSVNDQKITEHELRGGDRLKIGSIPVGVEEEEPEETVAIRDHAVKLLLDAIVRAAEIDDPEEFLVVSLANLVEMAEAERGILFRWEELEWRLARAVDGAGRDLADAGGYSASVLDRVRREGKPMFVLEAGNGDVTPSMEALQLRSVMVAPLRSGEKLMGAFYIDSRAAMRTFTKLDLRIFEAAVQYVATAYANVRASAERRADAEVERRALEDENTRLRQAMERRAQVIGRSAGMKKVYEMLSRAAPTDAPVLVCGETGTGKEAIARAVHEMSTRAAGPFVVVDCASIPETLMEAELFGYEKGAFTGATAARAGRIETAKGGTLFLDEIGDLSPALQPKILRALQEKEVRRVGSNDPIACDFRIVAATHRDLQRMVETRQFREDTYYRLAVVKIEVPPLRERGEDIELLADHFLAEAAQAWNRPARGFTDEARGGLRKHPWPGNVRELKHRIEQAVILTDADAIGPEELGLLGTGALPQPNRPLAEASDAFERRYIARALEESEFNVTHTAKALGISRQHLQTLMKKHNLARQ